MSRPKRIIKEGYEYDNEINEDDIIAILKSHNLRVDFSKLIKCIRNRFGVNKVIYNKGKECEDIEYEIYRKEIEKPDK